MATGLAERLRAAPEVASSRRSESGEELRRADGAVCVGRSADGGGPDLAGTLRAVELCARERVPRVVVLSSAEVCPPTYSHPGQLTEEQWIPRRGLNAVADRWLELEERSAELLEEASMDPPALLRPAPVPLRGAEDRWSRFLSGGIRLTVPGFDPTLQFLCLDDLARAIARVLRAEASGIFHVSPAGSIPLRRALSLSGGHRLPVPAFLRTLSGRARDRLRYLTYPWTVYGARLEEELGFVPERSSAEVVVELREGSDPGDSSVPTFDDFGMDREYIDSYGRTLFRFLHDVYWRVEWTGLEHVPRSGGGVLVGIHRGFMPWDGVMLLHLLVRELGRAPRFLIHPGLVKFPGLANYMTKLGGIHACRENADWVLERDELLGVFPEGIRGAFKPYREAYELGSFGRHDYVRFALHHHVPIIPFVTVGSAEIFPILGRIDWRWWKRFSDWPYLPIAPPFPLLPVPLPSKWHTRILPPIHLGDGSRGKDVPEPGLVRKIGERVRERMEETMRSMVERRESIFFGSIFGDEGESGRAAER